jgi:uncharacterized membrane protein (DUF485 family)
VSPTDTRSSTSAGGGETFEQVQETDEFQGLKRTLRRFVFPATVLFLAWYLLYVLMTAYARDFLAQKVVGEVNVAYVFGLLQFVSTFLIAYVYSKYADKHFDPTADAIRHRLEGTTPAAAAPSAADRTRSRETRA